MLGILTTIVLFALKFLFYDMFLPRLKEKISDAHKIVGQWESQFEARHDAELVCNEFITIRQLAEHVVGDIYYNEINKDDNLIVRKKHFEFKGTFVDSVLSATYSNTNRREKGRGSFCLVSTHADTLIGKYSWLDPDTNKVESDEYLWKRKE
jgi:hypothetical protein